MSDYYYHNTIRKVVVAFASLFDNIYVSRKGADGSEIERIKVPISYGPKQKFLSRLDRIGKDFEQKIVLESYLPRLSFEIGNLQYDSSRKLNSIQKTVALSSDNDLYRRLEKVPYNLSLSLNIMSKTMDDNLQIIEQILPMFGPEFTFTIKAVEPTDMDVDIPLVFSSTTMSDGDDGSYGDYGTRKITISNIQFTAKMYLYGPVKREKLITQTETTFFDFDIFDSTITPTNSISTVEVNPQKGVNAQNYDANSPIGSTNGAEIFISGPDYGDTTYLPGTTSGQP
jgi:hypothetical protein